MPESPAIDEEWAIISSSSDYEDDATTKLSSPETQSASSQEGHESISTSQSNSITESTSTIQEAVPTPLQIPEPPIVCSPHDSTDGMKSYTSYAKLKIGSCYQTQFDRHIAPLLMALRSKLRAGNMNLTLWEHLTLNVLEWLQEQGVFVAYSAICFTAALSIILTAIAASSVVSFSTTASVPSVPCVPPVVAPVTPQVVIPFWHAALPKPEFLHWHLASASNKGSGKQPKISKSQAVLSSLEGAAEKWQHIILTYPIAQKRNIDAVWEKAKAHVVEARNMAGIHYHRVYQESTPWVQKCAEIIGERLNQFSKSASKGYGTLRERWLNSFHPSTRNQALVWEKWLQSKESAALSDFKVFRKISVQNIQSVLKLTYFKFKSIRKLSEERIHEGSLVVNKILASTSEAILSSAPYKAAGSAFSQWKQKTLIPTSRSLALYFGQKMAAYDVHSSALKWGEWKGWSWLKNAASQAKQCPSAKNAK